MTRHVPLFINSSLYGLNFVDATVRELYSKPDVYVEGQLRFQEKYPTDMVPCPVYLVGEALHYGTEEKVQHNTAPILKTTYFEGTGKMPEVHSGFDAPFFDYYFNTARLLKERLPDKQLLAFVTSPADYGIMVFGTLKWVDMLLFERELYDWWLKIFADYHNAFKAMLMNNGVDVLITSNVFLNNRIIPDSLINGHIIPKLNEWLDPACPTVIHSTFMPVRECVKRLEQLTTSAGYVVGDTDDLLEISQMVAGQKLIAGNLGSEYFYRKTPQTIENLVYNMLKDMHGLPNYVLATSGADVSLDTTDKQLSSIYKGIERYEQEFSEPDTDQI